MPTLSCRTTWTCWTPGNDGQPGHGMELAASQSHSYSITCADDQQRIQSNDEAIRNILSLLFNEFKVLNPIVPNAFRTRFDLDRLRTGQTQVVADVHYSRMSRDMEQVACDLASHAMERYCTEREIAKFIKTAFDRQYGQSWHCTCGRHFGSFVTFEPESFIYFRIGKMAFMLYRTAEMALSLHRESGNITSSGSQNMHSRKAIDFRNDDSVLHLDEEQS
uniref:Dynein light chain n=1 Tax=Heterorhabditis bacteriophora TaxID=37862 RepID=A0A1I7X735_HETBA